MKPPDQSSHQLGEPFGIRQKSGVDADRLQVVNVTRKTILASNAEAAKSGGKRSKGLLGRDCLAPGEGMWIVPCEAIHTFFMRFAIDLVYLDRKNRVKKVASSVRPWRLVGLPVRALRSRTAVGTVQNSQSCPGDLIELTLPRPVHLHVRVKHQDAPALIEALIADVAMVTCSLLALGMACAGQSAKVARLLVVVFAGLSAGMNYLAADVSSFRSVAVYVMPPVVFAVCTDQTVAVIRRHGLGIAEDSAWTVLGRLVLAVVRLAGIILLYGLRFILAPAETAKGLRRMVLNAAPLPGAGTGPPGPGGDPRDRTRSRDRSRGCSRGDPAPGPGGRPRHPGAPPGAPPGDPGKAAGTGDPGAAGRVLRR